MHHIYLFRKNQVSIWFGNLYERSVVLTNYLWPMYIHQYPPHANSGHAWNWVSDSQSYHNQKVSKIKNSNISSSKRGHTCKNACLWCTRSPCITTKAPALTSRGTNSFWSYAGEGRLKCTPFSSLINLLTRPSKITQKN